MRHSHDRHRDHVEDIENAVFVLGCVLLVAYGIRSLCLAVLDDRAALEKSTQPPRAYVRPHDSLAEPSSARLLTVTPATPGGTSVDSRRAR